ncbi:HdeD family acid-resistance protein [Sphingobium aquiterrae]|uniref:HdeD family acid-resistance protein n=1 Tax=Sphingobium aquiterrae TaxID=2038656 RepID=UPI003018741B
MSTDIVESARVSNAERRVWGWFVAVGAALTLLGGIASANLLLSTVTATFMVGGFMFAGGVLQLAHAFGVRRRGRVVFWALSGLLYLIAAAGILYDPLFAAALLTLFVAISLGASGIVRVALAIGTSTKGRGWVLASGLVSLAAAVVIAIGWPVNALWMLGLILAIDLLFQGISLMLLGFTLRSADI